MSNTIIYAKPQGEHFQELVYILTVLFHTDSLTHSLMELRLLKKLPIVQPLKNFPAFYGTRKFITAFTRALHWSLS
jgi:hypothetical protein